MSEGSPIKSVRKGAKSCIECRHRKVRCVWPTEGADSCQSCTARHRNCEIQVYLRSTSHTVAGTSRARVQHLENEVSSLWQVVRNLEARLGNIPGASTPHQQLSSQAEPHSSLYARDHKSSGVEEDSDSNASSLSPVSTPSHLFQLFDNSLLNSNCYGSTTSMNSPLPIRGNRAKETTVLRGLMPSREDMLAITAQASSWIFLHNSLFPLSNLTKTSEEMMERYTKLQDPNADPVALATLLLYVAITVQQDPIHNAGHALKGLGYPSTFIKHVSDTVERIVIYDDVLAGSLDGIEATLLFTRLQMGLAKVSKMWLLLRRITALAELIGLPRASMTIAAHQESGLNPQSSLNMELCRHKAEVWQSICAIDRIQSLMWSLPLATKCYTMPKPPILDSQGNIDPQSYLYRLADIASHVHELDNLYSSGRPLTEVFSAVIAADQELRTLARLTPKGWYKANWTELSVDPILQYWQTYLTVRTHLQLALKYDDGQEFAFNRIACLNSCQELARRYICLRPIIPAGFFAQRVIDLQAFTATVFLLLATSCTRASGEILQAFDTNAIKQLVNQVVEMMRLAASGAGGDFARQAAESICSLSTLLQQPQTSTSQTITLNLALVGKIHVSRKARVAQDPQCDPTSQQQQLRGPWPTMNSHSDGPAVQAIQFDSSNLDPMDSLSYSMEIPDNYLFFADETYGPEPWLTWEGWDATVGRMGGVM